MSLRDCLSRQILIDKIYNRFNSSEKRCSGTDLRLDIQLHPDNSLRDRHHHYKLLHLLQAYPAIKTSQTTIYTHGNCHWKSNCGQPWHGT